MRGKKITEEQKEKLKAVIYLNPDAPKAEWSKQSGIPEATVHGILKDENFLDRDKFEEARSIKKAEFINEAWEVVSKALKLTNKRFTKALDDEDAIQAMVDNIKDHGLTAKETGSLISTLHSLQMTNIRDIAVALGTIYDKQALASGEPTQISESKLPVDKLIQEYDKKLDQYKKLIAG